MISGDFSIKVYLYLSRKFFHVMILLKYSFQEQVDIEIYNCIALDSDILRIYWKYGKMIPSCGVQVVLWSDIKMGFFLIMLIVDDFSNTVCIFPRVSSFVYACVYICVCVCCNQYSRIVDVLRRWHRCLL